MRNDYLPRAWVGRRFLFFFLLPIPVNNITAGFNQFRQFVKMYETFPEIYISMSFFFLHAPAVQLHA